jgi:hypothetical protein
VPLQSVRLCPRHLRLRERGSRFRAAVAIAESGGQLWQLIAQLAWLTDVLSRGEGELRLPLTEGQPQCFGEPARLRSCAGLCDGA